MAKKILIVDDEENIREIISEYLEGEGFEITEAGDGSEAWQTFQKEQFDMVITDIRMPKKNGLELLNDIKTKDPNVPVILMTGYDLSKNEISNEATKADAYVLKPFTLDYMLKIVESKIK